MKKYSAYNRIVYFKLPCPSIRIQVKRNIHIDDNIIVSSCKKEIASDYNVHLCKYLYLQCILT